MNNDETTNLFSQGGKTQVGETGGRKERNVRAVARFVSFRFLSFCFLSFFPTSFDLFHADESGVALSFSLLLSPLFHRARARDYFLWAGTLSVSASEGKKYSGIETNSFSYVPTRWPCIYIYIYASFALSVPSLLRRTFKLERETQTFVPRQAVSDSRSRGSLVAPRVRRAWSTCSVWR